MDLVSAPSQNCFENDLTMPMPRSTCLVDPAAQVTTGGVEEDVVHIGKMLDIC